MTPRVACHLGWVSIARPTFDMPLALDTAARARADLERAGFHLVGSTRPVSTPEETAAALQALTEQPIDLLILFQATFADSTMAAQLAEAVGAPLLLWAVPEERTGGRLRLNSLCGVNLAAHALRRAGRRYDYLYAAPGDPTVLQKITPLARAGSAVRALRQTRIGRIGEHPAGFDSCRYDAAALRQRFGVEVVQVGLDDVFALARSITPAHVADTATRWRDRIDGLPALDQQALNGTVAVFLALQHLKSREQLDGLAVRCWPEFFTDLGCAACGAMSMLTEEGVPCSCEADLNGTLTQIMLSGISGEPAFGTDMVSFDARENTAVLWHCGLAPLSMADPDVRPVGTIHSNRKLPLLLEFPLKPGRVTLARLSEATGGYRLVVGGGEMIRAPLSFSGTSGVIRFDRPADDVLDAILTEGLEHHMALTYGDHIPALLALAKMLDLPVLHLA